MIPVLFCNYNIDYQQRLGFLKLLSIACEGCRGNREAYRQRMLQIYEGRRPLLKSGSPLDLKVLLSHEDVRSSQIGFSPERLDRLVLWAEMTGIIAQNGRLSEWSRILHHVSATEMETSSFNPFALSQPEQAFFLQLLLFHDQVLPFLLLSISKRPPDQPIAVRSACLLIVEALGDFIDSVPAAGPDRIRIRQELRNLLQRLAAQYRIKDRNGFLSRHTRLSALHDLETTKNLPRVHLAEYHAICRFEQLTDLGVMTKDVGNLTPEERAERKRLWEWYPSPKLIQHSPSLELGAKDLEGFLTYHWIEFFQQFSSMPLTALDTFQDQAEIGSYLDATLMQSKRPLGPIQVHTWAVLAALKALINGKRLEIGVVYDLLDAIRTSSSASAALIRQGGRSTFLGRTASVSHASIAEHLAEQPVGRNGNVHD